MKFASSTIALLSASGVLADSSFPNMQTLNSLTDQLLSTSCLGCTAGLATIDAFFNKQSVQDFLFSVFTKACIWLDIVSPTTICEDVVPQYGTPLLDVIFNELLTRDRICDEVLGLCTHPGIEQIILEDVVADILATKPQSIQNDDYIDNIYEQIKQEGGIEGREIITAVHISDLHMDFDYKVGTNAQCGSPLCCREEFGYPTNGELAAGEWGTVAYCDMPQKTIQNLLDTIHTQIDPQLLIWTGDNNAHNVWSNTADEITNYMNVISGMVNDTFADSNTTILPIQGNHDTYVVDQQAFLKPDDNYEIEGFKDSWKQWLTDDAFVTFGKYGYYSMDIKVKTGSIPANSRLLALNTQVCDQLNWHILAERSDPGDMFAWLQQQLAEVEALGGIALMISHFDPSDCQHQWGTRLRSLVERYQHIIRFGLQGHTHDETFQVARSMTNVGKPVMVHSVGGSVTTYANNNPSFAVIDFDAKTMVPLNMKTYWMDLDDANATNVPKWVELHDMLDYYEMEDLRPSNWLDLATRIRNDQDLANTYQWNKSRQAGEKPTDVDTLKVYCDLASSENHEKHGCLKNNGEETAYGMAYSSYSPFGVIDNIVGNWIKYSDE